MSPSASFAATGSLAAALCVCVAFAGAQTAPAPATGPSSAPTSAPGPMVANPHYLAWAKYKPGTRVELAMNVLSGGQQFTTRVTATLKAVSPAEAIVESVARRTVPGVTDEWNHEQTRTFAAEVPQSEADRVAFPAGGVGEVKEVGSEVVELAGKTYRATVHAFTGKVQADRATAKLWRCDDIPGGLLKWESTVGKAKIEAVVTKVTIE